MSHLQNSLILDEASETYHWLKDKLKEYRWQRNHSAVDRLIEEIKKMDRYFDK